jgi:enoyl-CoA hydratase
MQGFRDAINAHFDTHQLAHVTEEFRRTREAGLAAAIARGKAQTAA